MTSCPLVADLNQFKTHLRMLLTCPPPPFFLSGKPAVANKFSSYFIKETAF